MIDVGYQHMEDENHKKSNGIQCLKIEYFYRKKSYLTVFFECDNGIIGNNFLFLYIRRGLVSNLLDPLLDSSVSIKGSPTDSIPSNSLKREN